MDPTGEGLEPCTDVVIVYMTDDHPVVNILGFFLSRSSSFEVFFMDRQPLLVWWNEHD